MKFGVNGDSKVPPRADPAFLQMMHERIAGLTSWSRARRFDGRKREKVGKRREPDHYVSPSLPLGSSSGSSIGCQPPKLTA
jgi:hypothetical protein